ncbi:hypothetical protein OHT52_16180 [Streptomyces sp. NBC_00247]|uniref:hypothetical protein n=1 Tax=Streptomyces sp. NBC_00247 TaxID=2975689 RepID=UPI002E2C6407|nr:hypothetical protein [Streptomyces sp. NBC_00247]
MTEQTVAPQPRADTPAPAPVPDPAEPAPASAPAPAEVPPVPAPAPPVPAPAPPPLPGGPAPLPPPPAGDAAVPVGDAAVPLVSTGWQEPPAGPRKPRRALRAVARWTAAVLVFGAASAGTAYGITSMERTDVPGLSTVSDGRWDYPELALPALPPGKARPFDASNDAEIHYADVRKLLLPAPAGSVPDKKLTGDWVPSAQFLSEFAGDDRSHLGQVLTDSALRHTAGRGWTMPDGTSTKIYLLQFNSVAFATDLGDELSMRNGEQPLPAGVTGLVLDDSWPDDTISADVQPYVFDEEKPYDKEHTRVAYVIAGDTVAMIEQSRGGGGKAAKVPFQQTVILQNQLLG